MTTTPARIKFREPMSGPRFILALGVWDPYTARVAEDEIMIQLASSLMRAGDRPHANQVTKII